MKRLSRITLLTLGLGLTAIGLSFVPRRPVAEKAEIRADIESLPARLAERERHGSERNGMIKTEGNTEAVVFAQLLETGGENAGEQHGQEIQEK
jgi:hypothetical protein